MVKFALTFNLCNINLADYETKNLVVKGYLPGFEPEIDCCEQLTEEKLYILLPILLSIITGAKVHYLICEPSEVKNLLQKQEMEKELLQKAQSEEQKSNLETALSLYSEIVNLGVNNLSRSDLRRFQA